MSHSDRPMTQDVHRLKVKDTVRGTGKKVRKKKKVVHRSAHPRKPK